ncbi:MAG: hypothetical protein K9G62_00950 [Alphaproteobacteria bacterium]|nr:hypothetical protein [Alphaproteobacteria bacterium]
MNNDLSPWQKSDNEWFDVNPNRSYRIRQAIPGEPLLKKYGGIPTIDCWVVVRLITHRVYSGIRFISKSPPLDNEAILQGFYEAKKSLQEVSVLKGRTFIVLGD